MLTPGLFVWADFVQVPDDAATVEAVGKQWHWSFRLPGADNELGASDVRHMSVDNPLGVDPEDPTGQDDIIIASPILHLPLNQSVRTLLRSTDVLHNFTVPQFRVKMDLVPGLVTYLVVYADRAGHLRDPLRGALRHRALRDARQGRSR